jgi:hypothetical protein
MKDSDYFLLLACVLLAPKLSKGWALFMWAINMVAFIFFFYVEQTK